MHTFLIDMLECPGCHGRLDWDVEEESDDHIQKAEARCSGCTAVYPVRDGIGIFLTPDLPRNDLWEQVDSQMTTHLGNHPEVERLLMEPLLETLSPTDQQFRALVLEERGRFDEARRAEDISSKNLYTPGYRACWNSQVEYMLRNLAAVGGPVVDIASGRGYLVERIASQLGRRVVASDFSPRVLRRDRKLFQSLGLDHLVSLLAFDARRTPFRDDTISTMTTNLGLPNIEEPGRLLDELNRVVAGTLLAISHFFPAEDELNREAIEDAGLDALLYRESTLRQFASAGWEIELENSCRAEALPTPPSEILHGARVDGLPVAPTELEWCVIRATNRDMSERG